MDPAGLKSSDSSDPQEKSLLPLLFEIKIQGVVQSVGFRPFIKNLADRLNLGGIVQNSGAEGVTIRVNCTINELYDFIERIKVEKPELSEIFDLTYREISDASQQPFTEFQITKSVKSATDSGSRLKIASIPPDITMCDDCIADITSVGRRFSYPITSCTNCGPRFSAIRRLPYDRETTSFKEFPLCENCDQEYMDPTNRRFHAQTTCCPNCGPVYSFFGKNTASNHWELLAEGSEIDYHKLADILYDGKIIALMGQGGTHYVVNASNEKVVQHLRKIRRKNSRKPFALMAKDLEIVRKYCEVSEADEKWLNSIRRPIVILPAKNPEVWSYVAPNMGSLGIMLPYTGLHHLLFHHGAPPLLVMTSANLPNLPMPIHPVEILRQTYSIADFVLVHNREIIQRIDDSVLRSYSNRHYIIRRSRGFVPAPLFNEEFGAFEPMLAFGAEMVNTAAAVADGKLFQTQHIGTISNLELLKFQYDAISHMLNLYNIEPAKLVVDLHPTFLNRINAKTIQDRFNIPQDQVFEVQHHLAHAMSMIADNRIPIDTQGIIWSCDGYGFGTDGSTWGGELLKISGNSWDRIASIDTTGYPGSDVNAIFPDRQLAVYLNAIDKSPLAYYNKYGLNLRHGQNEIKILQSQLENNPPLSTSMGRFLDAISALLNLSHYRSYRGEPAIVLEQHALQWNEEIKITDLDNFIHYTGNSQIDLLGRIKTIDIFEKAYGMKEQGISSKYIAKWVLQLLGEAMGELGNHVIKDMDQSDFIGFTGGVAYNQIITDGLKSRFDNRGTELVFHQSVPAGDAGICVGQALVVGRGIV